MDDELVIAFPHVWWDNTLKTRINNWKQIGFGGINMVGIKNPIVKAGMQTRKQGYIRASIGFM
jgi:hypothetical protein